MRAGRCARIYSSGCNPGERERYTKKGFGAECNEAFFPPQSVSVIRTLRRLRSGSIVDAIGQPRGLRFAYPWLYLPPHLRCFP